MASLSQGNVILSARATIADALKSGFTALRCASDMKWIKTYKISMSQLFQYETEINCLFNESFVAMCQYDRRQFDDDTLQFLLQNHAVFIDGGSVRRHDCVIQPDASL